MDWARFGGTSHHPEVTTMSRWAKSSLHSRLRCLGPSGGNDPSAVGIVPSTEPPALLGSVLALPNDREASATQRWGSLLQQLWGGWGQRWEQEFSRWVLSVLITTWHNWCTPFYNSSFSGGPCSPRGTSVFYILLWLHAACLSPRISCSHSRKEPGKRQNSGADQPLFSSSWETQWRVRG